jgi:hypothetical protein
MTRKISATSNIAVQKTLYGRVGAVRVMMMNGLILLGCDACTVEPRFTNAPVHEQLGSRTNFPSKNVSDNVRCLGLRTRKLATAAS